MSDESQQIGITVRKEIDFAVSKASAKTGLTKSAFYQLGAYALLEEFHRNGSIITRDLDELPLLPRILEKLNGDL